MSSATTGEWCPIYKWGQRRQTVYVTIFVPCLSEDAVKVDISSNRLDFRAERVASFAGEKSAERKCVPERRFSSAAPLLHWPSPRCS